MGDDGARYSMLIRWSEEDEAYLVALPEWEGYLGNWDSVTHGETYELAARNGGEVLDMLVDLARAEGRLSPSRASWCVGNRVPGPSRLRN